MSANSPEGARWAYVEPCNNAVSHRDILPTQPHLPTQIAQLSVNRPDTLARLLEDPLELRMLPQLTPVCVLYPDFIVP